MRSHLSLVRIAARGLPAVEASHPGTIHGLCS